jgi:hypothetical protein
MKIHFDIRGCEKNKTPVDVALYIAAIYLKSPTNYNTFQEACARGLIEFDGFDLRREPINIRLTPTGINLIESIILDSEFDENSKGCRYDTLAKEMQELFPKGRKPGTNLMWRDSQASISKRLKALVKKYNIDFTNEEALSATKKYVESFSGNYQYMQVLKYFISKKDLNTGEENSQFLSFLENGNQDNQLREDWMSTMR